VPICGKGDKTDCCNYRRFSLLPTAYTVFSNILLSRLTHYVDEIIRGQQCVFRRVRSTTDQVFYIYQIMEKRWDSTSIIYRF
jgi:hypothetical protein